MSNVSQEAIPGRRARRTLPRQPKGLILHDAGVQRRGRLEADRLEELLEVAAEAFIAQGFEGASINEIARHEEHGIEALPRAGAPLL